MKEFSWLHLIHKMLNRKKRTKCDKVSLPLSLFLIAGKFDNQEISSIMNYGEKFIEELKY
jgi:hypothetical protein